MRSTRFATSSRQARGWAGVAGLAALVASLAALPTGAGAASAKTYTIGSTAALTGSLATNGGPLIAGARAAVKYVNDNGGVKGSGAKLKLDAVDDGTVPQQGITNAKKILQSKPVAFLGHASSVVAIPVQNLLNTAQVPNFDPTKIDNNAGSRWNFHVQEGNISEYLLALEHIKKFGKSKGKRIGLMIVRTPSQASNRVILKQKLPAAGYQIVTDQDYLVTDTSLSAQAQNLANAKPDYIIAGVIPSLAPGFMRALKAAGVTAPVYNFSPGLNADAFRIINSNQFLGTYLVPPPNLPTSKSLKVMRSWAAKAKQAGQMTSFYFTAGWISVLTVAKGLEAAKCGNDCNGAKLVRGLESGVKVNVGDMTPPLTFSRTDHGGVASGRIYRYDKAKKLALPISPVIETPKAITS